MERVYQDSRFHCNQSSSETKTGTQGRNMEAGSEADVMEGSCLLVFYTWLAHFSFFYRPNPHDLRCNCHSMLGPLSQLIIKKISLQEYHTGQSKRNKTKTSPIIGLFSRCVKLTTGAITVTNFFSCQSTTKDLGNWIFLQSHVTVGSTQ